MIMVFTLITYYGVYSFKIKNTKNNIQIVFEYK